MKKIFLAMMALVIGLSFGLATFAQADEKKPTTAAEEKKKDEKDKKGGRGGQRRRGHDQNDPGTATPKVLSQPGKYMNAVRMSVNSSRQGKKLFPLPPTVPPL